MDYADPLQVVRWEAPFSVFAFIAVWVPVLFVATFNGMEELFDRLSWQRRVFKVAWDLAICAMGMVGAITVDAPLTQQGNPHDRMQLVYSVMLGFCSAFAPVVAIALMRQRRPTNGFWAILALILGAVTLAHPLRLAYLRP